MQNENQKLNEETAKQIAIQTFGQQNESLFFRTKYSKKTGFWYVEVWERRHYWTDDHLVTYSMKNGKIYKLVDFHFWQEVGTYF